MSSGSEPKPSELAGRFGRAARGRPTANRLPSTDDRPPEAVDRGPSTDDRNGWEAQHQRVTFYCPKDLLEAIEAEVERSKREDPRSRRRSKTSVIVDAIREHLDAD
jgi:hypothetical protein